MVRDRALCSSLSTPELARLNSVTRHLTVASGSTLMLAGDDSLVCGNILSGVMKMTAAAADGREQVVGLLYAADFVGRPETGELPFTITALTETRLCVFPRRMMQAMLDEHILMVRLLLQRTAAALDEARSRMLMLARGTAEEKIAGFLIEMIDRSADVRRPSSENASPTFNLPLSRGQIADVLGLTIETVSRQMSLLRIAGVISLPGGRAITIHDRRQLIGRAIAA